MNSAFGWLLPPPHLLFPYPFSLILCASTSVTWKTSSREQLYLSRYLPASRNVVQEHRYRRCSSIPLFLIFVFFSFFPSYLSFPTISPRFFSETFFFSFYGYALLWGFVPANFCPFLSSALRSSSEIHLPETGFLDSYTSSCIYNSGLPPPNSFLKLEEPFLVLHQILLSIIRERFGRFSRTSGV